MRYIWLLLFICICGYAQTFETKIEQLQQDPKTHETLQQLPEVVQFLSTANPHQKYVLTLSAALGQFPTLFAEFDTVPDKQAAIASLVQKLVEFDRFYEPIGGLHGYHTTLLKLLRENQVPQNEFLPPPIVDIQSKDEQTWKQCYEGFRQLDQIAFILPLGGAGDRLNLHSSINNEPLPAACLPFCGRTLFAGLFRDILAYEYWHYRLFNQQITAPVVIMTSLEKHNDEYIEQMGNEAAWFGRPKESVRRIVQPFAPLIDPNGHWVVSKPLELAMKPGGHGIVWKLAQDNGIFHWLKGKSAIVRQINNPLAGLDGNLALLAGFGLTGKKSFGFLSCPSQPGMHEGLNVLRAKNGLGNISNIEYTQFDKLQKELPHLFKEGVCPANTNILFARLQDINQALTHDPFPGIVTNPKTFVPVIREGKTQTVQAGRLESSMQNIADSFMSPLKELSTFVLLQQRNKLFSVAKKAYQKNQSPDETPEKTLYDWNEAMRELLGQYCHITLPKKQSLTQFLASGPSFHCIFHPALGPLWEVIAQKISCGEIREHSELELEIAEVSCHNLSLDGSLRIHAKKPLGQISTRGSLTFSRHVGRAKLHNFTVKNKGIGQATVEQALNGNFDKKESCTIILDGFSEVDAENVTINGPFHLVVPDGQRATLKQGQSGEVLVSFSSIKEPSWEYNIHWQSNAAPMLYIN